MDPRNILRIAALSLLETPVNAAAPSKPLPTYVCHKEVQALKIKGIEHVGGGRYMLSFYEDGFGPTPVVAEWVDKHGPRPGGYYVVYKDGYVSYSPARAFEEGYTAVQP